jgi:hypothetical protein
MTPAPRTLLGWTEEQWLAARSWAPKDVPVPPLWPRTETLADGQPVAVEDLTAWKRLQHAWRKAHDWSDAPQPGEIQK